MVKSKRVTQTQNPLWDQGFKNPRWQWSSNEDTTRKSGEGDEPPISKGRFISVICLKKMPLDMEEFGTVELHRKYAVEGGRERGVMGKKKENVTGWNSVACFDTCQTATIRVLRWVLRTMALREKKDAEKKKWWKVEDWAMNYRQRGKNYRQEIIHPLNFITNSHTS